MDYKLVGWIISFVIFWGYAARYIYKWGIPKSWSDTFYEIKEKYNKGRAYSLTLTLWGLAIPLCLTTLDNNPMMFLPIAAIMFIGAAPAFKDSKMEKIVHFAGSYTAVLGYLLVLWLSYGLWWLSAILAVGMILAVLFKVKNKITYIESATIFAGHVVALIVNVL